MRCSLAEDFFLCSFGGRACCEASRLSRLLGVRYVRLSPGSTLSPPLFQGGGQVLELFPAEADCSALKSIKYLDAHGIPATFSPIPTYSIPLARNAIRSPSYFTSTPFTPYSG